MSEGKHALVILATVLAVALAGLIVNDVSLTGKQAYTGTLYSSKLLESTANLKSQPVIATYRYTLASYAENCNAVIHMLAEEIYDAQREVNDCKTAALTNDYSKLEKCPEDLAQRRQEVLLAERETVCFQIMLASAPQHSQFTESEMRALHDAVLRILQEIEAVLQKIQG